MLNREWPTPTEMTEMLSDFQEEIAGIKLNQQEAMTFLSLAAHEAHAKGWCDTSECEMCNHIASLWWDVCNALGRKNRVELQSRLRANGVDLPPAPWEEEPSK